MPKVIETNLAKLKVESSKNKGINDLNKKNFIEEAKNINLKNEEERKKLIDQYENSIKQNKKEISNQGKIINEFEQKYEKEKNKIIDELLRLHKNLMNITYGYKNSFNDLNPYFLLQNKNSAITNATNILYLQKDEFEKILENEIKFINKEKYPLLFKHLKNKGENYFFDISDKNNEEEIQEKLGTTKKSEPSDFSEEKKVFKFFDGYDKKTEIEIENMNKNQLIQYSKQFLNRANEIEVYLNKYIQYKQGYHFSQEEENKIRDCNRNFEKANETFDEINEKYNKSKAYIKKNNQLIDNLTKENISLKKKLNNILIMEKLTEQNNIFSSKKNYINKKIYKENILDLEPHNILYKNSDNYLIHFDKDYKSNFANFSPKLNIKNYSYRCNTYNNTNKNKHQKNMKITFNGINKNRPFSSFQNLKTFEKK